MLDYLMIEESATRCTTSSKDEQKIRDYAETAHVSLEEAIKHLIDQDEITVIFQSGRMINPEYIIRIDKNE